MDACLAVLPNVAFSIQFTEKFQQLYMLYMEDILQYLLNHIIFLDANHIMAKVGRFGTSQIIPSLHHRNDATTVVVVFIGNELLILR